jgi:hypothetical protein
VNSILDSVFEELTKEEKNSVYFQWDSTPVHAEDN